MQIFDITTDEFNKLSSFEQAKLRHKCNSFSLSDGELTIEQFEKDNQQKLLHTITNSYNSYENTTSSLMNIYIEQETINGSLCPDDCAQYEPLTTFFDKMSIDTKLLEHRLIMLQSQKKHLLSMIEGIKRLQADYKKEPWQLADHECGYEFYTNSFEVIAYKKQLSDLEEKLAKIEDEIVTISKELSLLEPSQLTEDTIEEVEASTFAYLLKETTTQRTYYRTIQKH